MEAAGVEIFATKGAEYVFVIGFLLLLIFFWRFLNQTGKRASGDAARGKSASSSNLQVRIAEGFFYHQGHTWAAREVQNVVRTGVDDFALQLLGRPEIVDLPRTGTRLEQGEKGWRFLINSKPVDFLSPVGGEVVAVNEDAARNPSLINKDPYGDGWLVKVKVPEIDKNLRNLLSGALATAWMKECAEILHRRIGSHAPNIDLEGNLPADGIARAAFPDSWDNLVAGILMTGRTPRT
jgi:glycine cleavage system H lipoate-binding protein